MPEPAAAPALERILERAPARSIVDLARAGEQRRHPPTLKGALSRRFYNQPVKVPRGDWVKVLIGTKRMYRSYSDSWHGRHLPLIPEGEQYPRPAVIYSRPPATTLRDVALAVILGFRQEPLGAISPEDLATEGFPTLNHFKRYWKARYRRWGYRPRDTISVVQLRPWTPEDNELQAQWLLQHLFGEWLP
jgi:hypothetical protein